MNRFIVICEGHAVCKDGECYIFSGTSTGIVNGGSAEFYGYSSGVVNGGEVVFRNDSTSQLTKQGKEIIVEKRDGCSEDAP